MLTNRRPRKNVFNTRALKTVVKHASMDFYGGPVKPFVPVEFMRYNKLKNSVERKHSVNLPIERPLEMWIDDSPYGLTLRTPDDRDIDLAIGYCFAEGVFNDFDNDVETIAACSTDDIEKGRRIVVKLKEAASAKFSTVHKQDRLQQIKTSCAISNKETMDKVVSSVTESGQEARDFQRDVGLVKFEELYECFREYSGTQKLYPETGATHSAGIFDRNLHLLTIGEDIGRHNALDKAIGALIRKGRLPEAYVAVLSSRVSFEMTLKCVRAGIAMVIGISAATSLAVDLCEEYNVTLAAFFREKGFVVYSCPWRISDMASDAKGSDDVNDE